MRAEQWFRVLVVEGALLAGVACADGEPERDDALDTADDRVADTAADDALDTAVDTADPDACARADCGNTTSWAECTADGVLCCWSAGPCCDVCCP